MSLPPLLRPRPEGRLDHGEDLSVQGPVILFGGGDQRGVNFIRQPQA